MTTIAPSSAEQVSSSDTIAASLPPADRPFPHLRRNMTACVLLDSIFSTGWADICVALTPLLVYLNASNAQIGLVTGAAFMGLPGVIISPWITRHFRTKKYYLFLANVPYLAPVGLLGLLILLAGRLEVSNATLLTAVVIAMLAHQFFAGFVALPHQEYVAACIPMRYRGRYNGLSGFFGSLLSIGSAAIAGVILAKVEKPLAFAFLFLMTWFICQSGYIAALFAKEQPVPSETPKPWSSDMLRAVWRDKPYLRALLTYFVAYLTFIPLSWFIPTYALRELGMPAQTQAVIAIVTKVCAISTAVPMGWIIDRLGPHRVVPAMAWGGTLTFATLLLWPTPLGMYTAMGLSTILIQGPITAVSVLMYGLPRPENRAGHYTVQLLLNYLQIGLGPLLAGWLFDVVSFRTGFAIGLAVSILAIPFMRWMLKDAICKA